MPSYEVTIFPIFDPVHRPGSAPSYHGCLASESAISAELDGLSFVQALRNGAKQGDISLSPGHYLLLSFDDDIEEFKGTIFTVEPDGTINGDIKSEARVPRLTTWPPKP